MAAGGCELRPDPRGHRGEGGRRRVGGQRRAAPGGPSGPGGHTRLPGRRGLHTDGRALGHTLGLPSGLALVREGTRRGLWRGSLWTWGALQAQGELHSTSTSSSGKGRKGPPSPQQLLFRNRSDFMTRPRLLSKSTGWDSRNTSVILSQADFCSEVGRKFQRPRNTRTPQWLPSEGARGSFSSLGPRPRPLPAAPPHTRPAPLPLGSPSPGPPDLGAPARLPTESPGEVSSSRFPDPLGEPANQHLQGGRRCSRAGGLLGAPGPHGVPPALTPSAHPTPGSLTLRGSHPTCRSLNFCCSKSHFFLRNLHGLILPTNLLQTFQRFLLISRCNTA